MLRTFCSTCSLIFVSSRCKQLKRWEVPRLYHRCKTLANRPQQLGSRSVVIGTETHCAACNMSDSLRAMRGEATRGDGSKYANIAEAWHTYRRWRRHADIDDCVDKLPHRQRQRQSPEKCVKRGNLSCISKQFTRAFPIRWHRQSREEENSNENGGTTRRGVGVGQQ